MGKKYGHFYNSFSVLVTAKNLPGRKKSNLGLLGLFVLNFRVGRIFLTKKIFLEAIDE